jgi:hypothetical protein
MISLLRPSAAVSKPITGRGRWGGRHGRPCSAPRPLPSARAAASFPAPELAHFGHTVAARQRGSVWQAQNEPVAEPGAGAQFQELIGPSTLDHRSAAGANVATSYKCEHEKGG